MMTLAAGDDGLTLFVVTVLVLGAAFIAGLVFMVIDMRRHLKATAVQDQRCPRCNYDLHGAPHECCPECGSVTTPLPPDRAKSAR